MYTPEQEEKIEKLRAEREEANIKKKEKAELEALRGKNRLKEGDPVFVTVKGETVSGYIVKDHGKWEFDISTPHGIIEKVSVFSNEEHIRIRHIENLDGVEIPEELKTMTTQELLKLLQGTRGSHSTYYSSEQLKAELKNRPHVAKKKEKKVFSERKKKNIKSTGKKK